MVSSLMPKMGFSSKFKSQTWCRWSSQNQDLPQTSLKSGFLLHQLIILFWDPPDFWKPTTPELLITTIIEADFFAIFFQNPLPTTTTATKTQLHIGPGLLGYIQPFILGEMVAILCNPVIPYRKCAAKKRKQTSSRIARTPIGSDAKGWRCWDCWNRS